MAEHFAVVHLPVPMDKAMRIPKAKEAVDKEWNALANEKRPAWDLSKVKPRAEVISQANKENRSVHFGS